MLHFTKRTLQSAYPWIVLIHILLFLAFWLTNDLFYADVNDYLANLLGARYDYISLCLIISAIVGVWSIAQAVLLSRSAVPRALTWLFALVGLFFLVFFYGSFWYLFRQSPIQGPRLLQMLVYFRILLDPLFLLVVTAVLSLVFTRRLSRSGFNNIRQYLSAIAPAVALLVAVWLVLLIFAPGSVYSGALPPKPRVIAHRGASMLAPENTLAAMERAAQLGVYGVETDLTPSRDGIPYLMHDSTLKRTTNVAAVFPGRANSPTQDFALAEIQQLNAGEWFVNADPYHALARGTVQAADIDAYRQQHVPTLAEELDLVRKHKLIFIFDLKPLTGTARAGPSFFDIVFREVHAAGIDSQVWFLADPDQLRVIRAEAPAMHPAFGADYDLPPEPAALKSQGYEIVNAEYGLSADWVTRYRAAGLWVNLYTIDEPWQYSRLWLLGVDSTTSSNAHALLALNEPLLSLPYAQYLFLWLAAGLLCVGILFGVGPHSHRVW